MNISPWLLPNLLLPFAVVVGLAGCASFGDSAEGERLARMEASPQWRDGEFVNAVPTELLKPGSFWANTTEWLFGDQVRHPPGELPVVTWTAADFAAPPVAGVRAAWMGHATVLIELEGVRILTDPVLGRRASPFGWIGPERFHPPPLALEALPRVDVVVISHNHYDHLDMETVRGLGARGTRFFVPLGIGAHLEYWGIPPARIVELDWWESAAHGPLTIVCTPARHYSNRGAFDTMENLWSSWTLVGAATRAYYSGDTGFSPHFAEIGRKYGPFDLTVVKIGAYHELWRQIHMTPEEAIDAQAALRGRIMLPVHWGTFNMAYHAWDEPIRRAVADAAAKGVALATPRVGEWVAPGAPLPTDPWWKRVR